MFSIVCYVQSVPIFLLMVERNRLIRMMIQVNEDFHAARQEIFDKYPSFDREKDARITVFTNCILVLDGVFICFRVRSYDLEEDDWWKKMNLPVRKRLLDLRKQGQSTGLSLSLLLLL
jgi:hypothetical protein